MYVRTYVWAHWNGCTTHNDMSRCIQTDRYTLLHALCLLKSICLYVHVMSSVFCRFSETINLTSKTNGTATDAHWQHVCAAGHSGDETSNTHWNLLFMWTEEREFDSRDPCGLTARKLSMKGVAVAMSQYVILQSVCLLTVTLLGVTCCVRDAWNSRCTGKNVAKYNNF